MCFYRDTQVALVQSRLHDLIKQRLQSTGNMLLIQKPQSASRFLGSEPYKKLHPSQSLIGDLRKLSTGNFKSEPIVNLGTEEKLETPCEFRYLETALSTIEKVNKNLLEISETQAKFEGDLKGLINSTKTSVPLEESPFERLERESQNEKCEEMCNPNPSPIELLSHFTNGRTHFPYKLVLSAEISTPVFRERNLKIQVKLISKYDNSIVKNHGKMLLHMSLHTWETPSMPIIRNKAVLQGEDECELKNGETTFDKIQINEVTSKFIGGHIGILVVPKRPMNFGTSLESLHLKDSIRIEDIKPLLITKLVVKSKPKNKPNKMSESEDPAVKGI